MGECEIATLADCQTSHGVTTLGCERRLSHAHNRIQLHVGTPWHIVDRQRLPLRRMPARQRLLQLPQKVPAREGLARVLFL